MTPFIVLACIQGMGFAPSPSIPDLLLLDDEAVLSELQLMGGARDIRARGPDTSTVRMSAEEERNRRKLVQAMPSESVRRLQQLSLQSVGTAALRLDEFARAVGLRPEQRLDLARRYTSWYGDTQRTRPKPPPSGGLVAPGMGDAYYNSIVAMHFSQARDRFDAQTLARLTPTQRTAWKALLGPRNYRAEGLPHVPSPPTWPPMDLLREKVVQRNIGLDEQEGERVVELIRRVSLLKGSNLEEGRNQQARMALAARRYITPRQEKRLLEIGIQVYGVQLLRNPAFAESLGLSAEASDAFTRAYQALRRDHALEDFRRISSRREPPVQNMFDSYMRTRERSIEGMRLREERDREMQAVGLQMLTSAERARFKALGGKPFADALGLRFRYAPM